MIFFLRQLQEKCIEQDRPLYNVCVDSTKAFDTVGRTGLFQLLRKYGCPTNFTTMIEHLHTGMMVNVSNGGEVSDRFAITPFYGELPRQKESQLDRTPFGDTNWPPVEAGFILEATRRTTTTWPHTSPLQRHNQGNLKKMDIDTKSWKSLALQRDAPLHDRRVRVWGQGPHYFYNTKKSPKYSDFIVKNILKNVFYQKKTDNLMFPPPPRT